MLHLTDPTYLRYIVDGLHSQSIQQENLAALPQGLIGIYEEALPWEHNLQERGRFLEFFSVWSLLKKEVSATLVSSLLNWPEQEVIDILATHTKWFNSPASGTYFLYHERLRAYLLSKITSNQLKQANQKIIESCQHALELKKGDEWEIYALEHLPSHLLIPAMQDEEQGASLRKLVYDISYWNRQVEISKGYDWSKKMLNLAMVWAAKQNTDQLIECALNKIDLHYMEQNDAPRIVELVAQNDIETALQRIESFGGNDKEGLQRKFTLYMLCLMELTLLDSKDKPFQKSAIEKLLNHLDENIPVEHSLLNWNDFFCSQLMFRLACSLAKLNLGYLFIYKRSQGWVGNWIHEIPELTETEISVLYETACLTKQSNRTRLLINISSKLQLNSKISEAELFIQMALKLTRESRSVSYKITSLITISSGLFSQGNFAGAASVLDEAFANLKQIDRLNEVVGFLVKLSSENFQQGNFKFAEKLLDEALAKLVNIIHPDERYDLLQTICVQMIQQSRVSSAIELISGIEDVKRKNFLTSEICCELIRQNKVIDANELLHSFTDEFTKNRVLTVLAEKLAINGDINEALETAVRLSIEDGWRISALCKISAEGFRRGLYSLSSEILAEALLCAEFLNDTSDKLNALRDISSEFARQGKILDAFQISKEAVDEFSRNFLLSYICMALAENSKVQEALEYLNLIRDQKYRNILLCKICSSLFQNSQINKISAVLLQSVQYNKSGVSLDFKEVFLESVCRVFINRGDLVIARLVSHSLADTLKKCLVLKEISSVIFSAGQISESIKLLEEAVDILGVKDFSLDDSQRIAFLMSIATEFNKRGFVQSSNKLVQDALSSSRELNRPYLKSRSLMFIASSLYQQEEKERSALILKESYDVAVTIEAEDWRGDLYKEISIEYYRQGDFNRCLSMARSIRSEYKKYIALRKIAASLDKSQLNTFGTIIMKEALETVYLIKDKRDQCYALCSFNDGLPNLERMYHVEGLVERAIEISASIANKQNKSVAFATISRTVARNGDLHQAEDLGLRILKITQRQKCWQLIAKDQLELHQPVESLLQVSNFQTPEAILYYLKGWAESINVDDITDELAHLAIQALQHDSTSLEHFLQVYAQHELFFGNPSQDKIDRLHKTLNLQWVLDIIAQFPEE